MLLISLPTPQLATVKQQIRPLFHFDLLSLLPAEVNRHILAYLDLESILMSAVSRPSSDPIILTNGQPFAARQ